MRRDDARCLQRRAPPGVSGFTLVEALVAMGLTVGVLGAIFAMLGPARELFLSVPEATELQQRRRYLVQTLSQEILMAGHGPSGADGAPVFETAALLPYRIGLERSDARGGVHFRPGVLSVVYTPPTPETTARPMRVGERQVMAVSRTYYLKHLAGGGQLMLYDGVVTDAPLLDDVVELSFDFFADPDPPRLIVVDRGGLSVPPRTTYGPLPPPLAIDAADDEWGPGENCAFAVVDGVQVSRLARLADDHHLRRLVPVQLTDGPWCMGTSAEEPYDADLLRIRRVQVRATVQARQAFRGAAGAFFSRAGTARMGAGLVPDREVRFDVTPRNLERRW